MRDVRWREGATVLAVVLVVASALLLALPTDVFADTCTAECGPGDKDDQYCTGAWCTVDEDGCSGYVWNSAKQEWKEITKHCPLPM